MLDSSFRLVSLKVIILLELTLDETKRVLPAYSLISPMSSLKLIFFRSTVIVTLLVLLSLLMFIIVFVL